MEENKEIQNEEVNEDTNVDNSINEEVNENDEKLEEKEEVLEDKESTEEDELDILKKIKNENEKLKEEIESIKDRLLRVTAEYDNYRKRTTKEKEGIYSDAYVDVLKEVLPILDNLERAVAADGSVDDLKKGIEMTIKGCQESFTKLGVEEIDASGEFDPNLHNAVMHVEDENLGKNTVAEVFQKGYKKDEKVIRYSMVKVAN